MLIKKSALLLMVLAVSSVSLLVFSGGIAPETPVVPVLPVECAPEKCFQIKEPPTFSTWDMISAIMLRPAA